MRTFMRMPVAVTCAILLGGIVYLGGTGQLGGTVEPPRLPERSPVDAAACARLASLHLPNATVTSAQAVPGGKFAPPAGVDGSFADLPAFCRVAMTLTPSRDSDIKAETWLPLSGWNGKLQEVGNGGWGGSIQYGELADALRGGYVAASTDTGHVG